MHLTDSYSRALPDHINHRYELIEVRNAAAVLAASDPDALNDITTVLGAFTLTVPYLLVPGGSKSAAARDLDQEFRDAGWREGHFSTRTAVSIGLQPYRAAGERTINNIRHSSAGDTHKVDNIKGRVAVEIEWNAKDGNLDRDLAAFRSMYELGVIDAAVLITRVHSETHHVANQLATLLGKVRIDPRTGRTVDRFNTTTTTNLERLEWRLTRGDAGGCPVLGVGIGYNTYQPGVEYELDGASAVSPYVDPPGIDVIEQVRAQIIAAASQEVEDDSDVEQ